MHLGSGNIVINMALRPVLNYIDDTVQNYLCQIVKIDRKLVSFVRIEKEKEVLNVDT